MTTAYPDLDIAWTRLDRSGEHSVLTIDYELARHGLDALADGSVRQIGCYNVLQFLTGPERIALFNAMYRVLAVDGRVDVLVPYYSHFQAFAHPLTQWPPFSEWSFYFLDRGWRSESPIRGVPGLECDFSVGPFSLDYDKEPYGNRIQYENRSLEWLEDAARWYHNVVVALHVWLTRR